MAHKGSSHRTNEGLDLNANAGNTVIDVEINRSSKRLIRIVNIYNQRGWETGERPAEKLYWQKMIWQEGGSMVPTAEINVRSKCWYPRCTELREVTYRDEIVDEHRLVIGNHDRSTNYWMLNGTKGESIIDLTLAN